MCAAPFHGPAGPIMRAVGRRRWQKNPKYCAYCFRMLSEQHGGAEIECSLLFADVRGSTALAEQMSASRYRAVLDPFYETSSRILVAHDGIVDKFVGDEVMAIFVPALAGADHAARAVAAAREVIAAAAALVTPLPIGAGVHTGTAFVGAVGEPPVTELTALGDVVNTAARLASSAAAGEVLVSDAAATAAALPLAGRERRTLELKGKAAPTTVFVVDVDATS